jgi:hypothetical protein
VPVTAIRSVRAAEGKFVQIANDAAQDRRLSLRARGVLLFVLSLPPEKLFTAKWLESEVPEGREAVRSALRELEAHGYLRRERKHAANGKWEWAQVISDAPLTAEDGTGEPPSDGNPYDGKPSDGNPSDKELKTQTPNTQKMVRGLASRRARTSGASATRTVDEVIADVRRAITIVHGQQEEHDLTDDQVLGLYATYTGKKRVADVVAYMMKVLGDAPYLDTLMANVEPVCRSCLHWEDECRCSAASAA